MAIPGAAAAQLAAEVSPAQASGSAKSDRAASVDGVLGLRDLGRGFGTLTARAVAKAPLTVETSGELSVEGGSMEAQLARGLTAAMRHKGGVLTLRLSPEHLGAVKIELVVENGKVSATFDAQNDQTRQLLHANLDSLTKAIEERGMVVDRVQVVGGAPVSSKSQDSQSGRDSAAQQNPQGHTGDNRGSQGGRDESREARQTPQALPGEESGEIWTQEFDPAHGLLRLRLDAVV
ncbi:MAG: flagellar hook-length control protein FliK [Planctomycetota bacterium]